MPRPSLQDLMKAPFRFDMGWGGMTLSKVQFDNASNLLVSHQILPYNPRRLAIHFVGPNPGIVTVSNDPPVVVNNGLTFSSTAGVLSLYKSIAGRCIELPWHAINVPSTGTVNNWHALAAGASGAAVADVDTFTLPAVQLGTVLSASVSNFVGGAPTLALQLVSGATTVTLLTATAQASFTGNISLLAGDIIKWRVIANVAATTVDCMINGTQFATSAGGTPLAWIEVLEPEEEWLTSEYSDRSDRSEQRRYDGMPADWIKKGSTFDGMPAGTLKGY